MVLKKSKVTVVRNSNGELVPTPVQNDWRVCIDYRRLNVVTRKDHFPLPFIDQMLERLAKHEFHCFLDGYYGYLQVPISPEDIEKNTLHTLLAHMRIGVCRLDYVVHPLHSNGV